MRFDSDGLHIRQSDLKNHCLEKLRLETIATGPRVENDAATVGTALHHVIETELGGQVFQNETDIRSYAAHTYVAMLEAYQQDGAGFVLSSFNTHEKAVDLLANLASSWYQSDERPYLLGRDDVRAEWNFDLPFGEVTVKKHGKKAENIPIFLTGTADIILPHAVWDWKTAGREYAGWEKQRWDRQSDVYTWAASQAGLLTPNDDGLYEFHFKVFLRGQVRQPQTVSVYRSAGHWTFLYDHVSRLVNFVYNMGLDREWPTNDQDVLCSPKWCTFFDACKGAHIDGNRWL